MLHPPPRPANLAVGARSTIKSPQWCGSVSSSDQGGEEACLQIPCRCRLSCECRARAMRAAFPAAREGLCNRDAKLT
jgi:hypothetical protein